MDCKWKQDGDQLQCVRCDHRYPGRSPNGQLYFPCPTDKSDYPTWKCDNPSHEDPIAAPKIPYTSKNRPGDCLYAVILRWVGEGPTRECQCKDRITLMNAWGVAKSLEKLDEITGWLWEEATAKKWWGLTTLVPGSWNALRFFVERAIRKADPEETDTMPDCMSATAEMTTADMIRLIDATPPGPWPKGWASWVNVNEAHRIMAQNFADNLTPDQTIYPQRRGIVIGGGGAKYLPGVWVCVNLLRHVGCQLPIQLWYLGDDECDPYIRRLLKPLGVECIDARKVENEHPCRILCGWELKLYATLYSPFAEVLYLDADNGPVRDPTFLFDAPEYRERGAIFWPDYGRWTLKDDVWRIFGMEDMIPRSGSERAFESGQYVIDKTRCSRELRMALWYGEHSDFVFNIVYGDKECFHLGWRKLGSDYAMPDRSPGWVIHTITQHDFQGNVLFNHRCQDKWQFAGNRRVDQLDNEQLCFRFIDELKAKWSGALWHNLAPTPAEQAVIDELTGKRLVYRRIGHDERPVVLDAGGRVGHGSDECERRWDVNDDAGRLVLTISREDRPTCHLERDDAGTWRGQWLRHERMPIELVPETS